MEPLSSISAALNSSPPLPRLLVGVRWILISPRARTQTAPSHRRGKLIYKQQRPLAHLTVICTQRILTLLSNSEKKKTTKLIRCLAGSLDSTCLRSCAAVKLSLLTWISVTLMSPLSFSLCGYRLKISSLMAPLLLTPLLLTGAKSFLISGLSSSRTEACTPAVSRSFFMYETSAWLQVSSSSLCAYGKLKRGELICVFLCENRDGGC